MLGVLTMKLGRGLGLISTIHTPIAAEHAFTHWAHTSPQSKLERGVVSLPFSLSPVMKIWVYGVEFFPRYSFFVCLQ